MKNPTTPKMITVQINTLCSRICNNSIPVFLPVQPTSESKPNDCFPNVDNYICKHGGTRILGWTIWQRANVLIEAEAHAVWESPEGKRIDITPHSHGENEILFLVDQHMKYAGDCIPNVRMALSNSPLVAEFISLFNERDKLAAETPGDTYSIPKDKMLRMLELECILTSKAGRNEPCPCGSGMKYKRCCGQYD